MECQPQEPEQHKDYMGNVSRDKSYLNLIPTDRGKITSYIYVPSTSEIAKRKSNLDLLKTIEEKLIQICGITDPKMKFENEYTDYPRVRIKENDPDMWISYHMRRPVFRVRDKYYFRRYNDDWDDTVVSGKDGNYISWNSDLNEGELDALWKTLTQ